MHLFKGCRDDCCRNSSYYHDPTLVKATTEPSNGTTTVFPITSDCDTTEGSISSTTPYPMHTDLSTATTTNSSTLIETVANQPTNTVMTIAITVSVPLTFVVVVLLLVLLFIVISIRNRKSRQVSCEDQRNNTIPLRMKFPTVLVIYSSNTAEKEQESIRTMISELQSYGIEPLSHDCTCIQGCPSVWLEREVKKATTVLCVCNKEFQDEWEGQSCPSLPLVKSLQHLIQATIQTAPAESLSKYAVVLLKPSHRQYIPTKYLQSESRSFTMAEMEAIAHYVFKMPYYELSNESTINTPDSSAL